MRKATFWTLWCLAMGCSPPPPTPPPPTPPQAFLTVADTNVIDTSITGTTTTSGCKKVTQVQILEQGSFLADANYKGPGSPFEIPSALLLRLYSARGLAVPLTLSAKVVCDDGRTNTSQTVGVTFFPVVSVFQPQSGQAVPDSFVAEGGIGGSGTTFIGCIPTSAGTALARVDAQGTIVKQLDAMPFACTATSYITDKSPVRQTRWLMEPSQGAFAFDSSLNVTAVITGKVAFIGVARDGDALIVLDKVPQDLLVRAPAVAAAAETTLWSVPYNGIMNATPVVDAPNDTVWTATWNYNGGAQKADIEVEQRSYSSGVQKGANVLFTQSYANMIDSAVTPMGAFNLDGTIFYVPLRSFDVTTQTAKSTVLACATNVNGCQNAARRWASETFDGLLTTVAPFGAAGYIVAAGPSQTTFVSATTGATAAHNGQPIRPTGSQLVLGIQPGLGSDLFLLNGPAPSATSISYPTEIVAVDKPEDGELYRFSFGAGTTPLGGVAMAIDDGGQAWFRVGTALVRPQTLTSYRAARGATP